MDPSNKKPNAKKDSLHSYRKTDVMTANRETILLMMYSGAIRFLKKAIEATEQKDEAPRMKYITRTQEIIDELSATLNHNIGGELPQNLESLYQYCTKCLAQGNLKRDTKPLQEVLDILIKLNGAWHEAINSIKTQQVSVQK